jgi:hypothetical protein
MRGLIQVTATKGGKTITSEVYGDLADKQTLFDRLMNRHKIVHNERHLWKLSSVVINEEVNL